MWLNKGILKTNIEVENGRESGGDKLSRRAASRFSFQTEHSAAAFLFTAASK